MPSSFSRYVVILAVIAALPAAAAAQPRVSSSTSARVIVPQLFYNSGVGLHRPDQSDLVNRNGTPRVLSDADYERFWVEVAPLLEEWALDPRLALNPAYVAALVAQESGFDPFAVDTTPANGYARLTHVADVEMLEIARESAEWGWMLDELERWPRHPIVHRPDAEKAVTDSLVAAGVINAGNEYFFDPVTATRGAVFRTRLLAEIWTEDEFPGRYGSFARERLGAGNPVSGLDLFDLVTVSYHSGHAHVHDLVEQYGRDWTSHIDPEAADHRERISNYTRLFQK